MKSQTCHSQRRSPCRKNRRHRPRRNRTQNQTRRAWQAKAAPARLDPRHRHSPGSCRGHRADLPRSWHRAQWACAVFMTCSLVLFGNSACYHLGDWSPRVTDVLRRIDHMNIFLLIAGTYTPVSFALTPFWRDSIIAGMWILHHGGAHHPCHLDQRASLALCSCLYYFRRVRRRVHGIVLDVPICSDLPW